MSDPIARMYEQIIREEFERQDVIFFLPQGFSVQALAAALAQPARSRPFSKVPEPAAPYGDASLSSAVSAKRIADFMGAQVAESVRATALRAAQQFRFYEDEHKKAGKLLKAQTNAYHAAALERALGMTEPAERIFRGVGAMPPA